MSRLIILSIAACSGLALWSCQDDSQAKAPESPTEKAASSGKLIENTPLSSFPADAEKIELTVTGMT